MYKILFKIIGKNKKESTYTQEIKKETYQLIVFYFPVVDGDPVVSDHISDKTYDLQEECLSLVMDLMYDILENKLGLTFEEVGDLDIKNWDVFNKIPPKQVWVEVYLKN